MFVVVFHEFTVNVSDVDLPVDTASRLFSSSIGISVLADSVQQMAETRLSVCRDLLILVMLMQRLSEQVTERPVACKAVFSFVLSPHL